MDIKNLMPILFVYDDKVSAWQLQLLTFRKISDAGFENAVLTMSPTIFPFGLMRYTYKDHGQTQYILCLAFVKFMLVHTYPVEYAAPPDKRDSFSQLTNN